MLLGVLCLDCYLFQYGPRCTWLELNDPRAFQTVVVEVQRRFVSHMKLAEGIALNEARKQR